MRRNLSRKRSMLSGLPAEMRWAVRSSLPVEMAVRPLDTAKSGEAGEAHLQEQGPRLLPRRRCGCARTYRGTAAAYRAAGGDGSSVWPRSSASSPAGLQPRPRSRSRRRRNSRQRRKPRHGPVEQPDGRTGSAAPSATAPLPQRAADSASAAARRRRPRLLAAATSAPGSVDAQGGGRHFRCCAGAMGQTSPDAAANAFGSAGVFARRQAGGHAGRYAHHRVPAGSRLSPHEPRYRGEPPHHGDDSQGLTS